MSTAIGADNWNSPPAIGEGILKEPEIRIKTPNKAMVVSSFILKSFIYLLLTLRLHPWIA